MHQGCHPNPPESNRIPSELLPMRGADFKHMMSEIYAVLQRQMSAFQTKENMIGKVQLTGKIVWIVDRFVDIDFEGLKAAVPDLRDGDQLMVLTDETRNDQCSIYRIYNTESVPNVRYLGYGEPDKYPSTPAMEQFVNYTVGKMAEEIGKRIQNAMKDVANLAESIDDLEDRISRYDSLFDTINKDLAKIQETLDDHSNKIADGERLVGEGTDWLNRLQDRIGAEENRAKEEEDKLNILATTATENASLANASIKSMTDTYTADSEKVTEALNKLQIMTTGLEAHADNLDQRITALEQKENKE